MQARQILVDVVEDFATVEGVMERFEQWKEEDGDSYNDAYVSLCLPKVPFAGEKYRHVIPELGRSYS